MGTILSIWTVVVFILFIAIFLWAWSSRNKAEFDAAAQIPFDQEDECDQASRELNDG